MAASENKQERKEEMKLHRSDVYEEEQRTRRKWKKEKRKKKEEKDESKN